MYNRPSEESCPRSCICNSLHNGDDEGMSKIALFVGGVWGIIAPFAGIFFGLQVSSVVGNVLAFPVVALVYLTGTPFGMWDSWQLVVALTASVVIWAFIFGFAAKLLAQRKGA